MATTHRTPGETFAGYTQLVALTCSECGVLHAIPEYMRDTAYDDGHYRLMWYCPNGHRQGYGTDKREEAEAKAKREAERAARLAAQRDQAEASAAAQRRAAKRARNERDRDRRRVAHGVCPCCNRTFKQLSRHMAAKHPEFVQSEAVT